MQLTDMVKKWIKFLCPPVFIYIYHAVLRLFRSTQPENNTKVPEEKAEQLKHVNSFLLKNKHANARMFIAGTGQSIKNQNLLPLKDELVIGLNEFFLHPQIDQIRPKYSFYSGYYLHTDTIPKEKAIQWYKGYEEAMKKINSHVIVPIGDYAFIKENNLLQSSDVDVTYIDITLNPRDISKFKFDLPQNSYAGQNSAVMALCMAMFMGAKEIYLLGLDHDWIVGYLKKRQDHFYDDKDSVVYAQQNEEFNFSFLKDYLYTHVHLFEQYEAIEKFAKENGIKIINLTEGGFLDVFERKDIKSVLP